MLSGVAQGSVLGPVLFLIFINDLNDGLINLLLKFADDGKLFGKVTTPENFRDMQNDLQRLTK